MCAFWKKVPDFHGYEVSKTGVVRSLVDNHGNKRLTPKILKQNINRGGYPYVVLRRKNTHKYYVVSRLILIVFKGPQPSHIQAAHNDGNKQNNTLSNLKWKTPLQNAQDKLIHGTHGIGQNNPNSKLNERQVREINDFLLMGHSTRRLGTRYKISATQISNIKVGISWSHLKLPQIPFYKAYKIGINGTPKTTIIQDDKGIIIYKIAPPLKQPLKGCKSFIYNNVFFYLTWLPYL